jgi:SAM-dependent methyltransferase
MKVKQWIGSRLRQSPLYPHIYFFNHPFKAKEYAELVKGMPFCKDDVILDVGCGAGLQTLLFGKQAARIIGIDPDPNPIGRAISDHRECAPRIPAEFRASTIEAAKFPDGMFSKIFSVCVIEHIPDYRRALQECYRVLQPGGILSFSCDSLEAIEDMELKARHVERYFVRHLFTADSLKTELERLGFQDVQVYSIFRSRFARDLFMAGIRGSFNHRYAKSIWLSWRLRWADFFTSRGSKGLFLIARAIKPKP